LGADEQFPGLSRSKIGFFAGDLQGFCVSGGARVLIDQAAKDGFTPDLLAIDVEHSGAGSVRFVAEDALGNTLCFCSLLADEGSA
jgi:hypothetical protein